MKNIDYLKSIQNEVDFHAQTLVTIVKYLEKKYGKEAVENFKEEWLQEVFYKPWKKIGESNPNDIQTFVRLLEEGCIGSHEWVREINEPNRVRYRFTKCRWAEIFHELGRPDIGRWFCESDYSICRAFNPKMKLKRTKTLMNGDDFCDHEFFIED